MSVGDARVYTKLHDTDWRIPKVRDGVGVAVAVRPMEFKLIASIRQRGLWTRP